MLQQRFVGLVLLELSDLSSHAFSQLGNNFWEIRSFQRNKGQIFKSMAQAWHRNEAPKSAVLVHTVYMGTGAILVPGFGTQP